MRPLLLPALRRLWRDQSTLQLGIGPTVAVLLSDLPPGADILLDRLDGTTELDAMLDNPLPAGLDRAAALDLIRLLLRAGVVIDAAVATPLPLTLDLDARHRLAGDAASLSLLGPDAGGVLAARHRRMVEVHGTPRIAVPVATTLAAAGVGRVSVVGRGDVEQRDVAPGGLCAADAGTPRAIAAVAALTRVAPEVDPRPLPPRRPADLAVLAGGAVGDLPRADRLLAAGVPHLAVSVRDTTGVVGPLVRPGRSSCLRCAELHRRDRDPVWPVVAAQLATAPRPDVEAQDSALVTAITGLAALQALAQLDGQPAQAVDGTLELSLPDCRLRRRPWPAHPSCGCRAAGWSRTG